MEKDDLVEVYSTDDATKAEILRIALQNEGIDCEITDVHQAGFTGVGGFAVIHLLVRAVDADRARTYLEQHNSRDS